MQQCVCFADATDVPGSTAHWVHHAGLCINADVGLHAEELLVALFALVHLGVACFAFVFGRRGRGSPSGNYCCTGLVHQAALGQKLVDGSQIFPASLCFPSGFRKRWMVVSTGGRKNSSSWANSRNKGVSKNASSMSGSDGVNHYCMN